jgi:hypothetical protein
MLLFVLLPTSSLIYKFNTFIKIPEMASLSMNHRHKSTFVPLQMKKSLKPVAMDKFTTEAEGMFSTLYV